MTVEGLSDERGRRPRGLARGPRAGSAESRRADGAGCSRSRSRERDRRDRMMPVKLRSIGGPEGKGRRGRSPAGAPRRWPEAAADTTMRRGHPGGAAARRRVCDRGPYRVTDYRVTGCRPTSSLALAGLAALLPTRRSTSQLRKGARAREAARAARPPERAQDCVPRRSPTPASGSRRSLR